MHLCFCNQNSIRYREGVGRGKKGMGQEGRTKDSKREGYTMHGQAAGSICIWRGETGCVCVCVEGVGI